MEKNGKNIAIHLCIKTWKRLQEDESCWLFFGSEFSWEFKKIIGGDLKSKRTDDYVIGKVLWKAETDIEFIESFLDCR